MNYLAHFYLSGHDEGLIVGNYIADDVKGDAYLELPEAIQKGVVLHRKIDAFTDGHSTVTRSKDLIREHQQKYTPVVMDVFYDYFLAKNWSKYANTDLMQYTQQVYEVLGRNKQYMSAHTKLKLSFMRRGNWLFNYGNLKGIQKTLTGLSKRTSFGNNMAKAYLLLQEYETELAAHFESFFPELMVYVKEEIAHN